LKGPEYKIQFNREREATGEGTKPVPPPLLRNKTWPASAPVLVKRRSTRGREKDVALRTGMIATKLMTRMIIEH
jgi:hypothetical protein